MPQEIARLDARACAALRILDLGDDMVVMRGERRQALAEMHLRTRRAFGAAAQHTFEHDLRDGVGNLRRRPIRIGPRQPAEFVAAETRAVRRRALDVGRQPFGAQLIGDAEPAEMLHRARIGVVAFRVLRGFELLGDQDVGHAAPRQLDRSGKADRPAADDQRKGFRIHLLGARGDGGRRQRIAAGSAARQELAAVAQALLVDAVADAVRDVPLDRHAERGQPAGGMKQRLRRDEVVLIAVDQQHRRARTDFGRELVRVGVGRHHQQAGISDDGERRGRPTQADMQRHHGALAEADERQRRGRQIAALEFGIEKLVKHRHGFVGADPALVGIAHRERKPLPADRRLAAGLRCVRRDERGVRQQPLPGATDLDQIVAVGAVAVQEDDELAGRPGLRLEPWPVELRGHQALRFVFCFRVTGAAGFRDALARVRAGRLSGGRAAATSRPSRFLRAR